MSVWYGEPEADEKIAIQFKCTEKKVINALKEANKAGATSVILVLPKQCLIEYCLSVSRKVIKDDFEPSYKPPRFM